MALEGSAGSIPAQGLRQMQRGRLPAGLWGRVVKLVLLEAEALSVGLVVDWEPDGTEFVDLCFACGRETPPWKIVRGQHIDGGDLIRSYHSCTAEHEGRTEAEWFVNWRSEAERLDRWVAD